MSEYNDDLDQDVDNIIFQLKNQSKEIKNVQKIRPELTKDGIEKFILDNASDVITGTVEMINSLSHDVQQSADPEMIESVSSLIKSFTSAVDTLAKLKLSDDKIKGQRELKQMDIESKIISTDENSKTQGLHLSREELISLMFDRKTSTVEHSAQLNNSDISIDV